MPEFNTFFPTSTYGTSTLNVKSFGSIADNNFHPMSSLTDPRTGLPYANLAAAQQDYPSATSMSDEADWCAIVECFKRAFQHETSPGVWVPNGTEAYRNRPVCIPEGHYLITRPIPLANVMGAHIYGMGFGTFIRNVTATAPDNICIAGNGIAFTRFENLNFQATGTDSIAFDLNKTAGGTVNTNGDQFIFCSFSSPGGTGCNIGAGGLMGSEMTFINCLANDNVTGFVIWHYNALNYNFLGCGGTGNTYSWLRVVQGGFIVVSNASLAGNGEGAGMPDTFGGGYDIAVGGGAAVILGSRSESRRFVWASGPTQILGCSHAFEGNDNILVNAASSVYMHGTFTGMGRICGEGSLTHDGCQYNTGGSATITNIANAGGLIEITHTPSDAEVSHGIQYYFDQDEVAISGVASSGGGAAATNGVWIINKISSTKVTLVGSAFVADTYNLTNARISPGPHFHLRDILLGGMPPNRTTTSPVPRREPTETVRKTKQLRWLDSGATFDNLGATAGITLTLPTLLGQNYKGAFFKFVVVEAQPITIQVFNFGAIAAPDKTSRIFRVGTYGTAGTQIVNAGTSPGQIGASLELYLADSSSADGVIGHRWVVRSETGTWTISGTPA